MRRALLIVLSLLVAFAAAGSWVASRSGNQTPIDVVAKAEADHRVDLESSMISVNGIHLHVVQAGPLEGPPVILLHGYPEFWWGWHNQIPELAKAGFRVIVPDQRGFNASDKPPGVEAYALDERVRDIVSLIESLGYESVYVAGHDMGAVVAWHLAIDHPDKVRKLVAISVGHPLAYEAASKEKSEQETVSWYRTFFQIPVIPELVGRLNNWGLLVDNIRKTSREGTFSDDEMNVYRYAWDRDDAMHSMINWYRAGYRYPSPVEGDGRVRMPTKIIWGKHEAFSEARVAQLSLEFCDSGALVVLPDAGHWLLHEEPMTSSRLIIDFFEQGGG